MLFSLFVQAPVSLTVLLAVVVLSSDPNVLNAETCEMLFRIFETALLNNASNLYKLREMFFTNPPELVNVTYYMEFNSSDDSCSRVPDGESSACLMERPMCSMEACDSANQTYLNTTDGTLSRRYGWTSIGIYTLIHPALLNMLQIQLPFAIMRLHKNDATFLWNGQNQLPSINLYLFIPTDGLTCTPSISQVDGVMKSLTSLVNLQLV